MSQIIESRFRVLGIDNKEILLNDIADTNLPVYVNKKDEKYSKSLQTKIDGLKPGNIIEAEIQSRTITRQDDIWKFIKLKVTNKTRFHFIEDANNHSSHIYKLATEARITGEGAARTTISSDGESIGFITAGQDQGDQFWNGLQMGTNTHEIDIQNLEDIDKPPHEVIYTRNSDENLVVFYHLAKKDTKVAQAVLSANQ